MLAGVAIQSVGAGAGEFWARHTRKLFALDPGAPVVGALMTAVGFMSALWRRRVRVLTLLVLIVFVLYSVHPGDLYRLLSALAGLILGRLLAPGGLEVRWVRGSRHEIRELLAAVVAVTAVGPVISFVSGSRFGPLAPIVDLLLTQAPIASDGVARCQALQITQRCVHLLTLARINHPGAELVSVAPLVVLLVSAYGLLRARRFAVWLAAGVNVLLGLLSALYFGVLPTVGVPYVVHRPAGTNWEVVLGLLTTVALPLSIGIVLYGFRSLVSFKKKFQPEFHPMLMAYPDVTALPAIGLALTRA